MNKIKSTQIVGILLLLIGVALVILVFLVLFSDCPFHLSLSLFILLPIFFALHFKYLRNLKSMVEEEYKKFKLLEHRMSQELDVIKGQKSENLGIKILLDKLIDNALNKN